MSRDRTAGTASYGLHGLHGWGKVGRSRRDRRDCSCARWARRIEQPVRHREPSAAEPQPKKQGHKKHEKPQRGKAATKLIRTHELMKMERGISRKTGNPGKQEGKEGGEGTDEVRDPKSEVRPTTNHQPPTSYGIYGFRGLGPLSGKSSEPPDAEPHVRWCGSWDWPPPVSPGDPLQFLVSFGQIDLPQPLFASHDEYNQDVYSL